LDARRAGELKKALARAATTADAGTDEGDVDAETEHAAPTPTDAKDDTRAVVTPAAPANDTTPVPARKVG
jgi:hypothetical protein